MLRDNQWELDKPSEGGGHIFMFMFYFLFAILLPLSTDLAARVVVHVQTTAGE